MADDASVDISPKAVDAAELVDTGYVSEQDDAPRGPASDVAGGVGGAEDVVPGDGQADVSMAVDGRVPDGVEQPDDKEFSEVSGSEVPVGEDSPQDVSDSVPDVGRDTGVEEDATHAADPAASLTQEVSPRAVDPAANEAAGGHPVPGASDDDENDGDDKSLVTGT
jgi:segregation and condensation protein B